MIQFILNNKTIKTTANAGMTLVDFIRENNQLKGTKIGCREGDCGACTVLVGTLQSGKVTYQNITSCISPLGNANGKHIVTIEGINLPDQLNVAQQVMADNYATQCGFCTPGFVVSMTGYALDKSTNKIGSCEDAISGNICRCTGYKSIEKASNSVVNQLESKDADNQISWLIANNFIPDYFKEIPTKLAQLSPVELEKEGAIVANGTDLYVRFADQLTTGKVHLIGNDSALKGVNIQHNMCAVGAGTTVTELLENKDFSNNFPSLKAFLKLISSEPIRNMGTLGGNFVNASPIGDMSVFFLALNSTLLLQNKNGEKRNIPFQDFHQDYKKYDLKKDELITEILFLELGDNTYFNFEKVSKRTHLDIATVNSACRISVQENRISNAFIALGGVAAIPKFLTETNAFLTGKTIDETTIKEAEQVLQAEINPISDVRGTASYKRLLARQLFFAHFLKLFPTQVELKKLIA